MTHRTGSLSLTDSEKQGYRNILVRVRTLGATESVSMVIYKEMGGHSGTEIPFRRDAPKSISTLAMSLSVPYLLRVAKKLGG